MVLKIEVLDSQQHDRSAFCCGQTALDLYIRNQASQDLKRRVASPFVLVDEPEPIVLAYYTLSAYSIQVEHLEAALAKRLPKYPNLPATLLGRLEVDLGQRGKRFGELMLVDVLQRSLAISRQVASLAVVVDALDEGALGFYLKYGFEPFQGSQCDSICL